MRKEEWIVFYLEGKELCSYTVRGTFKGEMAATKELLAFEHGCSPSDITTKLEKR